MTYTDIRKQMLQGEPSGELYQVIDDMIALCEGIGMKPEDCAHFIAEQLNKIKPKQVPVVYNPCNFRNVYNRSKITGCRLVEGWFLINYKESLKLVN